MSNWINATDGASNSITFTSDLANSLTSSGTWNPDPLVEWLPPASNRDKYLPAWHIVRSYNA